MPSYAIIGASRGIGYGFLQHLSTDPSNIVIGTVRDLPTTLSKAKADNLKNVHILQADLTDYASLKTAAAEVSNLTGGSLDYLVVNGAYISALLFDRFLSEWDNEYDKMLQDLRSHLETNVIGAINAFNAFLPLIQKGTTKKIIALSTGMADLDFCTQSGIFEAPNYSVSKYALNFIVGKYHAKYGKDGILFLAMSPGLVDTGFVFPEDSQIMPKFMPHLPPDFKGPLNPEESVKAMLEVMERAKPDNGFGGQFVSHHGDKNWF